MKRWLLFLSMAFTFSMLILALASAAGVLDSHEGRVVMGVAVFVALLFIHRFAQSAGPALEKALKQRANKRKP